MPTTTSRDGTTIAYEQAGSGPPLLIVDGALCYRAFGPSKKLREQLTDAFTVLTYDRRGRGESADTAPYAVEREIEDIEAVVKEAGGSAFAFGMSSGAALVLEAANHDVGITKLATYEAPFTVSDDAPPEPPDYAERLNGLLAADRRGDAVKLFMKLVGTPRIAVVMMQLMPMWRKLRGVAPTLPYDYAILEFGRHHRPLPPDRWTSVTMPALVMDGGKSPDWMRASQAAIAEILPDAHYRTLEGQTHLLKAAVVAPVLKDFLR
ncbi:alpha/beta fold hydrolase [Phytoactinopolyspora mesophila]|uniref:Alpha/beta fold hydrolase n=1 Tax=Phytoactinopolyspora mesophila TaxID=2650750 RepID=A0A7K3M4L7_9ACTN|nr:alpha/beta hydrolase [Phytoactinopolyspora mesophila]NDL58254.1 alpha/beta fold hydrolase [Phytoactinopolyspora mesophila]